MGECKPLEMGAFPQARMGMPALTAAAAAAGVVVSLLLQLAVVDGQVYLPRLVSDTGTSVPTHELGPERRTQPRAGAYTRPLFGST